mgnify:CR=1 FL=1
MCFLTQLWNIILTNNDILRRIRYTFNFNDKKMVALFASAELVVSREEISQWLKKDNDSDFIECTDTQLATFLNGFINEKRGKKPGPQSEPEKRLTNNVIFTKLKIALNLQAEDIIALLEDVDFRLSKPELSAFSRKADHKNYRICKDQVLRNFLQAIDKKHHVARTSKYELPSEASQTTVSSVKPKQNHPKDNFTKSNYNKKTVKTEEPYIEGARVNASAIYKNPNANKNDPDSKKNRKVLKLK